MKNTLSISGTYSPAVSVKPSLAEDRKAVYLHGLIKKGIWAYFFLLIFEGALRKWVLPGLASPLLVIRDPLAIWLIYMAWKEKLIPSSPYLAAVVFIGMLSTFFTICFGHGNLPVTVFGARILLVHFPLIFVIGSVFGKEDVIRMGRIILVISIPMAILITLQFNSPQSAWVNRGVGGDMEGAGFSGAMGFFRPPATFSFTTGTTQFFSLAACYILYFWFAAKSGFRLILIGATAALLIAIPFSMSRSLLFQVGLSLVFAVIAISRKPQFLKQLFLPAICLVVGMAVLSQTSFFQTATDAFATRFENASETEGGLKGTLVDRFLGGMVSALGKSEDQPFFGYGIGMGTNVGSMLLSGKRTFLIAETEWIRLIGEMGVLMGLAFILVRVGFTLKLGWLSYMLTKRMNILPWMLFSFGCLLLLQGQWAQPTTLGFSIFIGGLIMASSKT